MTRRVTAGARRLSWRATVWMASISGSGPTSLSRKPLAPARRASNRYSSSSKVVSTRTRGGAADDATIRRVASRPSSSGMRPATLVAGQGGPHRPAAQVAAGNVEPSAAGRGPLGHPPQPVAGGADGRGLAAAAVVVDRDHQVARLLRHADDRPP